jgi:hypothetical protein
MTEAEFWAALAPLPDVPPPTYRLYYTDTGLPLFYTMEQPPGKYVEIDQATFAAAPANVRVVDGKLTYPKTAAALRLHLSDTGTPCHPTNVSVVVDETQTHTKWILK